MKSIEANTPIPITTKSQPIGPPSEFQEQVRVLAYQIYEQRGRADGHDLDDWLQAEGEVREKGKNAQAA